MKHVRKNSGKIETFNSKNLVKSVERAFASNHYSPKIAKEKAEHVTSNVVAWLTKKTEVTHLDIRHQAAKQISKIDQNVAVLYKKHKDLW